MSNRFAGVAYVNVSGTQLPVRANCTIHFATSVRTGIAGQDGVHGYSEMPAVPAIELDISNTEDVSAEAIQAMDDETVTATDASGKNYTLRNAWKSGTYELNTADGSVKVRFEGKGISEFQS